MNKILIADDNRQITDILSDYARRDGYEVTVAADGVAALHLFRTVQPDLILLDVAMPKKDGFQVCREIRQESSVPIIMITARGEDFERIMGLDIGADDYIVKPFSPGEVMARVRAVLRRLTRRAGPAAQTFSHANLQLDLDQYLASIDGIPVPLTKKEFELLWTLANNQQKVYSREQLLNLLWGYDYFGDSRTVDSHIRRLRAKLSEIPHPEWEIKTIWGVGYQFDGAAATSAQTGHPGAPDR